MLFQSVASSLSSLVVPHPGRIQDASYWEVSAVMKMLLQWYDPTKLRCCRCMCWLQKWLQELYVLSCVKFWPLWVFQLFDRETKTDSKGQNLLKGQDLGVEKKELKNGITS